MIRVIVDEYDAVGGPATSSMGGDGFMMGPTDPGAYVVSHCGRHISKRYPDWSGIPWGTPVTEEGGTLFVQIADKWEKVSKYSAVTKRDVEDQYFLLYGSRRVPSTWVFNDFGHMTCFLYKDRNRNRKLDGDEKLHGEFLHTTPSDEAASAQNIEFNLSESHGCVHLRPAGIDEMIKKKYLRRGNSVIVHKYSELTHNFRRPRGPAEGPYEVHFFPGMRKIVVLGRAKF